MKLTSNHLSLWTEATEDVTTGEVANKRRGTVLIAVVVIVMLLSLAAYKYMLTMQTEHMAVVISGDRLQAQQAAYSARDLLTLMLESPRAKREEMGGLNDNPLYFGGNPTALNDGMQSSITSATSTPSTSGSLLEQPPFGTIAYVLLTDELRGQSGMTSGSSFASQPSSQSTPLANATASADPTTMYGPPTRYGAKNESAKLHLMKILQMESDNAGDGVAALMQLPGMEEEVAEAILDWIDEDDEARTNGAESEFYSTLARPMTPRNNLPPDIDELLFVKGVTPWQLFGIKTEAPFDPQSMNSANGSTANSPFTMSSRSSSQTSNSFNGTSSFGSSDEEPRPWAELLTVYSAERNESYTGQPRLFLNSKDLQELHGNLAEIMPSEWATFVILFRQLGPSDASGETPAQIAASESVTINFELPSKFFITNPLDLIGSSITVPAEDDDEEPLTIESPFGEDAAAITPEFVDLLDRITLVPEKRIVGRVNINEAPAEVLLALPGMTETVVEAIMSDRDNDTRSSFVSTDTSARRHPIRLLIEGLVDVDAMRLLWPHVTCGGDVYRAEIWGYVDDRSPTVRFETVLDASLKKCRPVYYRELSAPKNEIQIKAPAELVTAAESTASSQNNDFGD